MVNVLIVDDSAFVRRSLISILENDSDIKIVGSAANGEEAVELARKLDPDVITMDVEMPRMDGLAALKIIMAENPCPVIMLSSLTSEGADTTLKAMELGALDFMLKTGSGSIPDFKKMESDLCSKIKTLARRKAFMRLLFNRNKKLDDPQAAQRGRAASPLAAPRLGPKPGAARGSFDVVAIGVSTGGPPAVQKVLAGFPADFPAPILIAQHMPSAFTGPFAKRLDGQSKIQVKEAEGSESVKAGTAYICPGGRHLRLEMQRGLLTAVVTDEPKAALYKPSANVLMETVGSVLGRKALCVMLTGMGNDGLEGTKILKEKGGYAIAQSEATCVVYGMPKAIVDAHLADEIVDIDDMCGAILAHFNR